MQQTLSSTTPSTRARAGDGLAYAVLRRGGAPPVQAKAQLDLAAAAALRLEAAFRAQAPGGEAPKFAFHKAHVAAVMAQGGFCAFSERRVGPDGVAVCLPLIWPRAPRG